MAELIDLNNVKLENNPRIVWNPLVNGVYTGLIQGYDTYYNTNIITFNVTVDHSLPPNSPPNIPSKPHPTNGSTQITIKDTRIRYRTRQKDDGG